MGHSFRQMLLNEDVLKLSRTRGALDLDIEGVLLVHRHPIVVVGCSER